jgi:imidazolonepropionase-like amidohydrolase
MRPMARTLYRDGALADGRSDRLELGVSILVEDGAIRWIRPADDEGDPAADRPGETEIVDASGSTFVPGMVDCHSHLTLPGGAHWIARIDDPPERMLAVAEHNGQLMTRAGVRWARDVGAPVVRDPVDGRRRALSLGVRDRWRDRPGTPYVRAAGCWVDRAGTMPGARSVEAETADELVALALGQLDDGADFIKLYMDGPEPGVAPWSVDEVAGAVAAIHARGAKVTAHSGDLAGARVCIGAGVDSIEHGMELDAEAAAAMAAKGIVLVSTLTVFRSWQTFATTTAIERFTSEAGRGRVAARRERAEESVRLAHAAGVAIATGTDFGGGSSRANQLPWEVESLVAAGLAPWEALGAATWRGGELLGEPDAGVIREGGPADFALVHGDPLSDPTALWRVWRVAWT